MSWRSFDMAVYPTMTGSWLPTLAIQDVHRLGSYLSDQSLNDGRDIALGVILVTAPWHPQQTTLLAQQILLDLTPQGLQNVFTFAATITLETDDDVAFYIGDDGSETPSLPVPPSSLPAIAVVCAGPGQSTPTITYVNLACEAIQSAFFTEERAAHAALTQAVKTLVQRIETDLDLSVSPASCSAALRIFIAGDRSSVGKSSVCLGLLGSLLQNGYAVDDLAYIKPATQSESTQPIQIFCEHYGIDCIPIGPLVYYRGFTRAFLAGETPSTEELLERCARAVDRIARGKRVVLVDGVGFPAVGSICGTNNAAVLKACSYAVSDSDPCGSDSNDYLCERNPMGVVLVGGIGVGAAVDAFNLNATYFESKGVPVLGAIFNKLPLTGFYSLENCKEQVTLYFDRERQLNSSQYRPFGFVPLIPAGADSAGDAMDQIHDFIRQFMEHVDALAIVAAASEVKVAGSSLAEMVRAKKAESLSIAAHPEQGVALSTRRLRSRQEIEQEAVKYGARKSA